MRLEDYKLYAYKVVRLDTFGARQSIVRLELLRKLDEGETPFVAREIYRLTHLSLEMQGSTDNVYDPLQKSTLHIGLIDDPDKDNDEVFASGYTMFWTPRSDKWLVVVKDVTTGEATATVKWRGFVTPDSYQEDLRKISTCSLMARDNIGHMDDITIASVPPSTNEDGLITIEGLVRDALDAAAVPYELQCPIIANIHSKTDDGELVLNKSLHELQLMSTSLVNKTYYKAVEEALVACGLKLYIDGESIVMTSLADYADKMLLSPMHLQPIAINDSGTVSLLPAYKQISDTYKDERSALEFAVPSSAWSQVAWQGQVVGERPAPMYHTVQPWSPTIGMADCNKYRELANQYEPLIYNLRGSGNWGIRALGRNTDYASVPYYVYRPKAQGQITVAFTIDCRLLLKMRQEGESIIYEPAVGSWQYNLTDICCPIHIRLSYDMGDHTIDYQLRYDREMGSYGWSLMGEATAYKYLVGDDDGLTLCKGGDTASYSISFAPLAQDGPAGVTPTITVQIGAADCQGGPYTNLSDGVYMYTITGWSVASSSTAPDERVTRVINNTDSQLAIERDSEYGCPTVINEDYIRHPQALSILDTQSGARVYPTSVQLMIGGEAIGTPMPLSGLALMQMLAYRPRTIAQVEAQLIAYRESIGDVPILPLRARYALHIGSEDRLFLMQSGHYNLLTQTMDSAILVEGIRFVDFLGNFGAEIKEEQYVGGNKVAASQYSGVNPGTSLIWQEM